MSIVAAPDRSPATPSRSAAALNLIDGCWVEGRGNTNRDIHNPADTAELLAPVREAAPEQVDEACAAALRAFPGWRATPAPDRAHVLFKFRDLLEKNYSDLAHSIVRENGKLLSEARGSLRRGLDVVEFACGIPSQLMGLFTQSGAAARTFRERIQAGMLGVNLGVPAPMAFFPFGGWKSSLYGDLYAQGTDAIAFYTHKKVISERWFGSEGPEDGWV